MKDKKIQEKNSKKKTISPAITLMKEGYYLNNFLKLLNFVQDRYRDLLTESEIEFTNDFQKMGIDAQRLFVRLIMRKGPYFRLDKLAYPEINIPVAMDDLVTNEFIAINPREEISLALQIFTKKELYELFIDKLSGIKSAMGKDYLVFEISENLDEMEIWEVLEARSPLIVPLHQDHVRLNKLLFFGNLRQGMEEFIFEDLGLLKFEKYEIRPKDRFFSHREIVDSYFILSDLRYALWELKSIGDIDQIISLGLAIAKYGFSDKYNNEIEKIYLSIGSYLEKNKLLDEALAFFAQTSIYPAKERMVRILDKQNQLEESFDLCSFLLDSENYYEQEFAIFYLEKIKKKLGQNYLKNTRKKYPENTIELPNIQSESVEEAVLNHYYHQGWKGYYTESKIWAALCGLLFWDIIFSPRPNVFFNPYQRGPMDLFTANFYLENKEAIESRLEEFLFDNQWQDNLVNAYKERYKTANLLIDWKRVTIKTIQDVVNFVAKEDIINISRRIIINPAEFKSGLPDLLIIDPHEDQYFLVEVKGPGDQLQPNQRRWLNYFEKHKIPFFVQKVKWETEEKNVDKLLDIDKKEN